MIYHLIKFVHHHITMTYNNINNHKTIYFSNWKIGQRRIHKAFYAPLPSDN